MPSLHISLVLLPTRAKVQQLKSTSSAFAGLTYLENAFGFEACSEGGRQLLLG